MHWTVESESSMSLLAEESAADKKKAKEAALSVSRIPGARDVKAKQAKIVSSLSLSVLLCLCLCLSLTFRQASQHMPVL